MNQRIDDEDDEESRQVYFGQSMTGPCDLVFALRPCYVESWPLYEQLLANRKYHDWWYSFKP